MFKAYGDFWRRYFTFTGRSTRSQFWWAFFWNALIGVILIFIQVGLKILRGAAVGDHLSFSGNQVVIFFWMFSGWYLVTLIPRWAVTVRRLRDAGLPWGLVFLKLLTGIGHLVLLVLACLSSKDDD